ncbi:MAG: VanZ family protein [Candidatus Omnitrophica bacterium]|nr:VanZ family protein [Candidatus Omnitrophota bacterium]
MLHLIEYAILGYLIARAAYNSANSSLKMHFRAFAVIIGFLYALSDEFHQYFVPGRYVEVLDVAADGLGAFVGQLFLRVK